MLGPSAIIMAGQQSAFGVVAVIMMIGVFILTSPGASAHAGRDTDRAILLQKRARKRLEVKSASPPTQSLHAPPAGFCAAQSYIDQVPDTKVHTEVNLNLKRGSCHVKLSDAQLVQQCRASPAGLYTPWPDLSNMPLLPQDSVHTKYGHEAANKTKRLQKKYEERVKKESGCTNSKGMWANPFNSRCTMAVMAEGVHGGKGWQRGDLILDWGSGCGHQATWMAKHYDVRVLGIDLNAAAIEWAQQNSVGRFAGPTDATNLAWFPDNTFDHFFSFATVYYVHTEDMCRFGKEVARVVKPGGSVLFGWLDGIYSRPYGQ